MLFTALLSLALGANVNVDVGGERRAVSDGIYGVSFGSQAQVVRMGATLRRFGGNAYSRYNYLARTTNEGGDGRWFRNVVLDGGVDEFLAISSSAGTGSVVELPLLGWVAKPGSALNTFLKVACTVLMWAPMAIGPPSFSLR